MWKGKIDEIYWDKNTGVDRIGESVPGFLPAGTNNTCNLHLGNYINPAPWGDNYTNPGTSHSYIPADRSANPDTISMANQ